MKQMGLFRATKIFQKKSLSVLFLLLLFIFHFFIKLDLQSHMFMSKTK